MRIGKWRTSVPGKRKEVLYGYIVFVAQDSHGQDTNGAPVADPEQDCTLVGGRQNESHTVVRFRRAMDTCDRNHDYVLRVSLLKLLRSSQKYIRRVLSTKCM
jgi:hypothetical protein